MKKTILTLMIAIVMVMAIGCSKDTESEAPDETAAASERQVSGFETSIFGKVKSIVGNEIELEIAEPPFDVDASVSGDSGSTEFTTEEFIWDGEGELPEGLEDGGEGEVEAESKSGVVIAVSGEDGQTQIIGGDDGQKMDLTYTGETKSIIIPAGTEILNLIGGTGLLEDIKKGSVLMIGIDDETASEPKALNILIME